MRGGLVFLSTGSCGTKACLSSGSEFGLVGSGLLSHLLGTSGGGQLGRWHPSQSHCLLPSHLTKLLVLHQPLVIIFFFPHNLLNLLNLFCKGLPLPHCQFLCQQSTFHTLLLSIPQGPNFTRAEHPGAPHFLLGKSPAEQPLRWEVFSKMCRRN